MSAADCDGKPCWKSLGTKGYGYGDKPGSSEGITGLTLKSGVAGKARIQVKAGGANLAFGALPWTMPVVVQLLVDDGDTVQCWQTTFTNTPHKNDASRFKAKQ